MQLNRLRRKLETPRQRPLLPMSLLLCSAGLVVMIAMGAWRLYDSASQLARIVWNERLEGTWQAALESPGGVLPFDLVFETARGRPTAHIRNGHEQVPVSAVHARDDNVEIRFDWYDSEIRARYFAERPARLEGRWRKTQAEGDSMLAFRAHKRLASEASETPQPEGRAPTSQDVDLSGRWTATFTDEDGTFPALAIFDQQGHDLTGTFLTPTGDYRYLAGEIIDDGGLRLATFDGAHAFLFVARAHDSAGGSPSLEGTFFSRDSYQATWTATRLGPDEPSPLPDPFQEVGLTNDDGRFDFSFPDTTGQPVSLDDARFRDKPVVVSVFGTWCPNCNDEAPLLAEWHRRYRDRGLEVVGLAYELRDDFERSRRQIERYAERHGIEFPLLVAGTSNKEAAGETLPDLTAVLSFPTTIFLDRHHRVRKIHSGFAGPGTGKHHDQLVGELTGIVEEIVADPTR